jgi:hypothetical protein
VDIGSFSDVAEEAAAKAESSVAAVEAVVPQPVHHQEEASPEFTRDLEITIHKGEDPVQDVPLLETHEDLPEGQDPSPSVAAFNKSFGTSHRGELLSVGCEVARNRDGAPRILTLWKSSALIDEQEREVQNNHFTRSDKQFMIQETNLALLRRKLLSLWAKLLRVRGRRLPYKTSARKVHLFSLNL